MAKATDFPFRLVSAMVARGAFFQTLFVGRLFVGQLKEKAKDFRRAWVAPSFVVRSSPEIDPFVRASDLFRRPTCSVTVTVAVPAVVDLVPKIAAAGPFDPVCSACRSFVVEKVMALASAVVPSCSSGPQSSS